VKTLAGGTIISHRNDGMGARLIASLNAVRIARDHGLPWHICWTTHGLTRPELRNPADLFSPEFVAAHLSDVELMQHIDDRVVDLTTLEPSLTREAFLARAAKGQQFLSALPMGVVALPWEDAEAARLTLPSCLAAFEFSAPVQAMMARIDEALSGATLTAYHIRRGDIIDHPIASNKLWPSKYIPREFYEAHLARTLEDPLARVLVFSDTPEEVARLKAVSPNVASFDDLLGASELTMSARDFLELYAMSRCRQIFGPPSSAFSQTAALIGGGSVEAVQDALSPEDHAAALDVLTDRLEAKSDLFLNHGDVGQSLNFMIEYLTGRGHAARAKAILDAYVEDGLDKGYVYRLMCELAVASGDVAACPGIRDLAYARPAYVEDALQSVNSYAAIAHLVEGVENVAMARLQAAVWTRPLDPVVMGVLNLGRSLGIVTSETYYPFDEGLSRNLLAFFPNQNRTLNNLNGLADTALGPDRVRLGYPWDITVRDWQFLMGKRLGRPFTNLSKTSKAQAHFVHTYAKQKDTPAFGSTMGVYARGLGALPEALELQRQAKDIQPGNALYRKRIADVFFARKDPIAGLRQLRLAAELSRAHPCYVADLAHRLILENDKDEGFALLEQLVEIEHDFVEIHFLNSEVLRRLPRTRALALVQLERAISYIHGSPRLMQAHARLLMPLDRAQDAQEVYAKMVAWGIDTELTHVQIYRAFSGIGRDEVARDLTGPSAFDFETVKALALV
jgi:tetratricopeptide (TPR) repeat protein